MTNKDAVLEAKGVFRSFQTGSVILDVLKGVDLEIYQGEIVALIGPSGSGKSTLLHILGALDRPDKGSINLDSVEVFSLNDKELAHLRNRTVGFVFQFHHLLPEFSALENVMLPKLIAGEGIKSIENKAMELLDEVGLKDRKDHKPGELSGGEQQRVAVARALINDPKIVIADEPSGNLDRNTAESLHNLILELNRSRNQTFVLATHNLELAQRANRIFRLKDGQVERAKF
ncbi:MAG: ABC transporter ATP-binding protein [candidate division Zixibacteria bacterium RBG_16_43_9]|nr:MAG: ABC transporter ATP-binding protein [candidate division Zixibacteria bacterium RBG_16_43_9]